MDVRKRVDTLESMANDYYIALQRGLNPDERVVPACHVEAGVFVKRGGRNRAAYLRNAYRTHGDSVPTLVRVDRGGHSVEPGRLSRVDAEDIVARTCDALFGIGRRARVVENHPDILRFIPECS